MKAVRLENFKTKTPPGKSAEEWRRKKKNLTNTGWSSAPAESGETGGKDTGAAGTPPERRPTYSETMQGYYGDRYADALAENKTAADAAAETAERDAQDALERIRGGYKSTDRQLYREYMESKRTLPQRLAAQGITGGLTESSQVRLANSYGEELAENETDVIYTSCPAFYDTETDEVHIFSEYEGAVGMTVTDEGLGVIGMNGASGIISHTVMVNIPTATEAGTSTEWIYDTYGIIIPDNSLLEYISPDGRTAFGYDLSGEMEPMRKWYVTRKTAE